MMRWIWLLTCYCHLGWAGEIILLVKDLGENPIADVRIGLASGNLAATDHDGRLVIETSAPPGTWLTMMIGDADYRWISPWDGRVLVPGKADPVHVLVLAKKGDKYLLTTQVGMDTMMKMATNEMQPKNQGEEVDVQTALKRVAQHWGLPTEDIERAIRDYKTDDDYAQGLKKLLEKKYREAEPFLLDAVSHQREQVKKESEKLVEGLNALGLSLYLQGKYAKAAIVYRQAYDLRPDDLELRSYMFVSMLNAAEYQSLEPLLRQAVAEDEAKFGSGGLIADSLGYLARLLGNSNRLVEAEPLYRRALAIDEAAFGADHPKVARDLTNLATLLQDTNRLAEAEPLKRRALAIFEAVFGADHPHAALGLNKLAQLLKSTNRLAEAEPLMRRALAIDEAAFGADHPVVARDLNNLAGLFLATNWLAEAEPLMRRALAIDEAAFGADHPVVARDLNNLAGLFLATNRLAEAEPLMRRALAIDEASSGADHPDVALALSNLAILLYTSNRLAEAESLMRRSLAIAEEAFGANHPKVAIQLNRLAKVLQATNRLAEAEPMFWRALAIDEASLGADHPDVAGDLNNLACIVAPTDCQKALALWRRALTIYTKSLGSDHPYTNVVQRWLDYYLPK